MKIGIRFRREGFSPLLLICLAAVFLNACCFTKKDLQINPTLPYKAAPEDLGSGFVVVADSQIHNVYGTTLKQEFNVSDLVSRVSIRPPELNILAKYSLEMLLKKSRAAGAEDEMVFMLGDATNLACSGEYTTFEDAINEGVDSGKWLMAHGNHDSYLQGLTNSYRVGSQVENSNWPPIVIENNLPTDANWWNPIEYPVADFNWRDACYSPASYGESSPMNKLRWLSRYMKHLESYGVKIEGKPIVVQERGKGGNYYSINSEEGAQLDGHPFTVKGQWFEPIFTDERNEVKGGFRSGAFLPYTSYILQAYDIDKNSWALLIDTSVCRVARAGVYYVSENVGTRACLGNAQLTDIEQLLSDNKRKNKNLILLGHSTLNELEDEEKEMLMGYLEKYQSNAGKGDWTYVSAHTHFPLNFISHEGGVELNIGSSTDWPMEAHRFFMNQSSGKVVLRDDYYVDEKLLKKSFYEEISYIDFRKPAFGKTPELCRHLETAKKLVNYVPGTIWESPRPDKSCLASDEVPEDVMWSVRADELRVYLAEIDNNMTDPGYREAMFKIMATASKVESQSYSLF